MSSIIGRFLNYLLVPLHTAAFAPAQFGVITEMYAYVAFLVILLTYGMETAFFRFANKPEVSKDKVFSTALLSLIGSTSLFIIVSIAFAQPIANWLKYPDNAEYVIWFAFIVGLDAISSIPLAQLRSENRPVHFAFVNLSSVFVNIGLNLFFLAYCKPQFDAGNTNLIIDTFYNPEIGVGYVFIANLLASIAKFMVLVPQMLKARYGIDTAMLKMMLVYALPLLMAGLAGMVNETLDRILLKHILYPQLGQEATMAQIGIYGACYKVSIIITLFIQAFRYAAEPFFFAQEKEKNSRETYAHIMNYFVIVCAFIFLGVMLYIDIVKYFINERFWGGLHIVPILLFANIFLGIYYNQSIWFKLSDKTRYGAILAALGAVITIVINFAFIPKYGYLASTWATFTCYSLMMVLSYALGHKHYPIPYNLTKIVTYLLLSFGLYKLSLFIGVDSGVLDYTIKTTILAAFIGVVYLIERPKF